MSRGDKSLRNKAIPFEASVFNTIGGITILEFGGEVEQLNALAYARPYAGDLIEARFTMSLTAPPAEGFNLRIAIGEFSDSALAIEDTYTENYLNLSHRRITGRSTPYSVSAGATLFLDELDLLRGIPKRDEAGFNADGFVVLLVLDSTPTDADGFVLNALRCLCSAQMGLT